MKEDILYIDCVVEDEVLRLQKERDDFGTKGNYTGNIYVSIFRKDSRGLFLWKVRNIFYFLWHIIKHGEPYGDDVIIGLEDRERIIKFLK